MNGHRVVFRAGSALPPKADMRRVTARKIPGREAVLGAGLCQKNQAESKFNFGDGAQGRNRTTDTCIFSAVLYRLSYLGELVLGYWFRVELSFGAPL
jgi:hypothetical protein